MIEKLQVMRKNADQALATVEALRFQSAPPDFAALLEEVSAAAREVIERAQSPIKVAIGGEFNAGKSLLIGSLIGNPNALPVSEVPTTGNATHLRFSQADTFQPTRIDTYAIHYLDERDLRTCLKQGLTEAQNSPALPPQHRARAAELREGGPTLWQAVTEWCQQAWNDVTVTEAQQLLRELHWLAQAYLRYRPLLRREPYIVPAEIARRGLMLADSSAAAGNALKPENFFQPPRLTAMPDQLSEDLIRASFPLVRRIEMNVHLPREIWDLSKLRGTNEFVLVDLPGLGAAHSTFRDRYICSRELADIHTILLLLDSRRIGSGAPAQLLTLMASGQPEGVPQDYIIAGIGRFDHLALSSDSSESWLKSVTDSSGTLPREFSEQELLSKMPLFGVAVREARRLTGNDPERLSFLSPMLWVHWASKELASLQIGTSGFPLQTVNHETVERWRRLAQLLSETEERSSLIPILEEYARDGGISRLRSMIRRHVEKHGLRQRWQHTREAEARLEPLLKRLNDMRPPEPIPLDTGGQIAEIQAALGNLITVFITQTRRYENNPPRLFTSVDGRKMTVREAVSSELAYRVFSWDVWQQLFSGVRNEDAHINATPPPQLDEDDDDLIPRTVQTVPSNSKDFFPLFAQTVRELEGYTQEKVRDALRVWLDELSAATAPAAELLRPLMEVRYELEAIFQGREDILQSFIMAVYPKDIEARLLKRVFPENNAKKNTIVIADVFPLPGGADTASGRRFAWAPELQQQPREFRPLESARHQVQIQRLRRELSRSAAQQFAQIIGKAEETATSALLKAFGTIVQCLSKLSEDPVYLSQLALHLPKEHDRPSVKGAGSLPFRPNFPSPIIIPPSPQPATEGFDLEPTP